MKNSLTILFVAIIVFLSINSGFSQTPAELHIEVANTINSDPAKAEELAKLEILLSKENSSEKVDGMNDLGNVYYYFDQYDQGEKILMESIEMANAIDYSKGAGEAHTVLGNIYLLQGKLSAALTQFTNGLEVFQKINESDGIGQCYNGLGNINLHQENYEKALEYFNKALTYGDDVTKSDSYVCLSEIYLSLENYDDASKYADFAYDLAEKTGDTYVKASSLDLSAQVLAMKKKYHESLQKLFVALELKEALEDDQGTAATLVFIGNNYKSLDMMDSSLYYMIRAYDLAQSIGANEEMRMSLEVLAKLYASKGDYTTAFFHQSKYIEINEAIYADQASKKIAEMEAEMAAKVQEDQIALMESEKAYNDKMFKVYAVLGVIVLLMLLGVAGVIYSRYKVKKRAHAETEAKNAIIQEQKYILEEKNTEIMDSITYAKRIQNAILPSDRFFAETLPNAFILYKPKDIIAGDFYWVELLEDRVLFAAADCTGHGVPGAMVSVVCNNALNRSVREFELQEPSLILDKTRELVVEQFEKSDSEVKDGMDISLCALESKSTEDSVVMKWSGANNPIWVVRSIDKSIVKAKKVGVDEVEEFAPNKSENDCHLYEIKADKQPIGKYTDPRPFTNWEIELFAGDLVYIFTDGFADQFGGEKGKKFMASNFKKLLLSLYSTPFEEHKEKLDSAFMQYMESHEQVDDVCVIGVRV